MLSVFKPNALRFATGAEVIKKESGCIIPNGRNVAALELDTKIKVENLVVYPIKSCGGFSANVWPLSNSGELGCHVQQLVFIVLFVYCARKTASLTIS